jgi:carnitine O-acetyltransferase
MDGAQDLPKLPIPGLSETCARYLEAVAPLLTPSDLERTKAAIARFQATDGERLQASLRAYAEDKPSYIEEFWYESYEGWSAPVVLNVNPFFVLADDPMPSAKDAQISRAASLVISSLQFCTKLRRGELRADEWRGRPLCMKQYSYLFSCARVPTDTHDTIERYEGSQHIAVLSHGLLYYFDVLWPDGTELCVSEAQLCDNLSRIVADARQVVAGASASDALASRVGLLTTDSRAEWAAARLEITKRPANAELLRIVDSALFVLCLDADAPSEADKIARAMLHGSYELRDGVQCGSMTNRWYDKLQIIVCANGTAGVNFEHTRVDGHTVLRFVSDVFADTIMRFAAKISTGIDPAMHSADPTRLARRESAPRLTSSKSRLTCSTETNSWPYRIDWEVERGSRLRQRIQFAEVRLSDLVSQHETRCLELDTFGKLGITRLGASPDAFVQLALMATYFSLYGQVVCAYEPVQTKAFLHGRTEAARTMTSAAVRFVRAWVSDAGDDAKEGALRAALSSIGQLHKAAAAGQGVDRHLFALLKIWERTAPKGAPRPAIFDDKAWAALNHTILSTSNCGNPALRFFGFGPVVENGFGVGYIIKDYRLSFCASSKHRQTARFLHTLELTLVGMRDVLARVLLRKRSSTHATAPDYGYFDHDAEGEPSAPNAPGLARSGLTERRDSPFDLPRPGKRVCGP